MDPEVRAPERHAMSLSARSDSEAPAAPDGALDGDWTSLAAHCRGSLERAVDRFRASESARAGLLAAFLELDGVCDSDIDLMAALLRSGDPNWMSAQELWFEVGRAAVFEMRRDIAERIGRFSASNGSSQRATVNRSSCSPPTRDVRRLGRSG